MREEKAWLILMIVLTICTAAVLAWTVTQTQMTERSKFEHGYEQVALPGIGYTAWQLARRDTVRP